MVSEQSSSQFLDFLMRLNLLKYNLFDHRRKKNRTKRVLAFSVRCCKNSLERAIAIHQIYNYITCPFSL